MSDQSSGPGWWQASDGKWYAPETHPDYTPPPTPAPPPSPPPAPIAVGPPASKPWWQNWWAIALGVLIPVAVLVVFFVGTSNDTESPDEASTTDDQPEEGPDDGLQTTGPGGEESTEQPPSTQDPTPDAATTTVPAPPEGRGTADDPLVIGTGVDSEFFFSQEFGDTTWRGSLRALVETDFGDFSEDDGRCLLLLGILIPVDIDAGLMSSPFTTPSISVIVDGTVLETSFADCNIEPAEAAGYGLKFDAQTTVGTSYAFYEPIFIPSDGPQELEAIVIGDPRTDEAQYFEPTVTTSIPPPDTTLGEPIASSVDLAPPGPVVTGEFTYSARFTDTAWEGSVLGLVDTGPGEFSEDVGRCLLVLGTLTPTDIGRGVVSSPFDAPEVGVIADGALRTTFADCDTTSAEAAGYRSKFDIGTTVGTSTAFYEVIFIEGETPREPEAIVVGDPTTDEAWYFEPTVTVSIPSPPSTVGEPLSSSVGLAPVREGTAGQFVYADSFTDAIWEGTILGLVDTGPGQFSDEAGRCLLVLGTLTPTRTAEGEVSDPFSTPQVGVIADGALDPFNFADCDTTSAEAAGYGPTFGAEVTIGTTYRFYESIFLKGDAPRELEAIVIGDPTGEDPQLFEPTLLSSIPLG